MKIEHLSTSDFLAEYHHHAGLIPVNIQSATGIITWMDVEKYHFYEGFFQRSINTFLALKRENVITFTTDFDVLDHDIFASGCLQPNGFIFHAGRCRSTLLVKALARLQHHLILSEPAPLNQFWQVITNNGTKLPELSASNQNRYRNLALAMSRQRSEAETHCFIKFTSFNIRFFSFINDALPGTPAIFLTRDVDDIVTSFEKKPPEWLLSPNPGISKLLLGSAKPDLSIVVKTFLDEAASHPPEKLKHFNYDKVSPEGFELILKHLNISATEKQLGLMKREFLFDSKTDVNRQPRTL
jgi:hypothetical protein